MVDEDALVEALKGYYQYGDVDGGDDRGGDGDCWCDQCVVASGEGGLPVWKTTKPLNRLHPPNARTLHVLRMQIKHTTHAHKVHIHTHTTTP